MNPFRKLKMAGAQLHHLHLWVTLLLALIFGTFFALLERRIFRERQKEMVSDIETSQIEVQNRLRDTMEYFTLLGEDLLAENLSETAFQGRASHFIDNHPEITAIGWTNEEDGVNWISSRAVNNFDLVLQREEFKQAAGRARDQGDYAFSNFFRTFRGEKSFAVFVPIYKEDSFLGSFFGIYSLDRMVHSTIPTWIDERYDISFLGEDNLTLVREPPTHQLDDDLFGVSNIISQGFPVRVRLQLYQAGVEWQNILLMALSLGVIVGVGLAIRELNNDRRLKKELAEQMRTARDLAESANQTKSEFVANVSHELRTPLTAILGYADLCLRDLDHRAEIERNVNHIARNGQHLLMLINDLLDHSKLEAGYLDVRPQVFNLNQMLTEILLACDPVVRNQDLELILQTKGFLPLHILADPLRFKQVMHNILGNALKFTERGKIYLQVNISIPSLTKRLELRIIDPGIGIASEQHQKIFEVFSQANPGISRQFGGTGLGLALARKLARLMGGELTLETSEPGQGSCFLFTLPLRDEEVAQIAVPDQRFSVAEWTAPHHPILAPITQLHRLDGRRILLVEDSPDLQNLLQEYLLRSGAQVELVGDGETAVDRMLGLQRYDAVLMDIQLPGADGCTTTQSIRSLGLKDLPIIALTAHAGQSERQRCLDSGCTAYLAKPFTPNSLIEVLRQHMHREPSLPVEDNDSQTSSPRYATSSQLKADPKIQAILEQFLRRLPERIEHMEEAWRQKELAKISHLAHTLKGTAANFGYPQLSEAAHQLERATQDQTLLETLSSRILDIKNLTESLTRGLALPAAETVDRGDI